MTDNELMGKWFDLREAIFNLKCTDIRKQAERLNGCIDKQSFLEEYGTLNLNFGRQTGNTTFAKHLFRMFKCNSLFVAHDMRNLNRVLGEMGCRKDYVNSMCTLREFINSKYTNALNGLQFRYIIFNTSDCIAGETLDNIPPLAARVDAEMIIYC